MSAERPIRQLSDADIAEVFRQAAEIFPCDVPEHDRLLDERDAAIRRAAGLRDALEEAITWPSSGTLQMAQAGWRRTTWEYDRAALRSQESQKPPETEKRT